MSIRIPPELMGILPPAPGGPPASPPGLPGAAGPAPVAPPILQGPGGAIPPPVTMAPRLPAPPPQLGLPNQPPPANLPPIMGQINTMAAGIDPAALLSGMSGQPIPLPASTGALDPANLQSPTNPNIDPLMQALGGAFPLDPKLGMPKRLQKGYRPPPEWDYITTTAQRDKQVHRELLDRFQRDLNLYRNYRWLGAVPPLFDPKRDIAFRSATLPNIVNKLTNMSSAVDHRYVIEFKDEPSKHAAQIIENFHTFNRRHAELDYAQSGGGASLQWDEFWFLYLYGRLCYRILPDEDAADRGEPFPYHRTLLDPATCFPTWGNGKQGLIRMTRVYNNTMVGVLDDYQEMIPGLADKFIAQLGYDDYNAAVHDNQMVSEVTEWWDTWNHALMYRGVQIFSEPHELGYVPFVYVVARGEPRNVAMPNGVIAKNVDEYNNVLVSTGIEVDLREKGVSVFHHIINTDRMAEIVYTLLVTEVLKAQNPPTITYSAPQLGGKPAPPLKMHAGATNQRQLNAQKVDAIPTSPRPTDTSPVLNKVQKDVTEGSINTAMFGGMDGSNIAGFAVESLISAARDTILPYQQAWCYGQSLAAEMILRQYRDRIWMRQIASVPMDGRNGSDPTADLKPEMIDAVGFRCKAEFIGVPDNALPMVMQASTQAVHEGFWSRRKAMEKLGEKDPDRMLSDIIAERAMEHPEMMENFIIPMGFMQRGQKDFAQLWILFVLGPKFMQMMSSLMPMGMPNAPTIGPGGSGSAPTPPNIPGLASALGGGAPPQMNGQSNPMMGRAMGPPTGPLPGQGRA